MSVLLPEAAGPHDPAPTTPPRPLRSIRRTSTIDTHRPDGITGDLMVVARARDLVTDGRGGGTVVAETELRLRLDGTTRKIVTIAGTPEHDGLDTLVGLSVGPGFRARMDEALPGERDSGSLRYLLLDDLPGAGLVSGYAMQRAGLFDTAMPTGARVPNEDLCAGWARDSKMMVAIRSKGVIPTPMGPPAPELESADDPLGWHTMEPLSPHGMRRRRRLDVVVDDGPGATHLVDVHFRDSHVDAEGSETVVHEYTVRGSVDGSEDRVVGMEAEARVLPWMECPGALASAGRLAGMPVSGLRAQVRRELTGTSSCTHLNDTLRSLSDVPTLASVLATATL